MSSEAPTPGPGQPEVVLAKWSDRFFAWLIDFIIVSIAVNGVLAAAAFPFWYGDFDRLWWSAGSAHYGITSAVFFLYWTFFEVTKGQSVGKMVLKIKTTDLAGRPADAKSVAIQSFGKAFLLPLDVLLGWIFTNDRRQRIFNRASDTLVVKALDNVQPGVTYRKD